MGILAEIFAGGAAQGGGDYKAHLTSLPETPVIVDIGANVGAFTMYVAWRFPKATIFAYEPCLDNYRILNENIRLNSLQDRVKTFPVAVGEHNEQRTFYPNAQRSLDGSFYTSGTETGVLVPVVTLEQIFYDNALTRVDLLKLDCEGAEFEILRSTSEATIRRVNAMSIEVHEHLKVGTFDELSCRLRDCGCTVHIQPFVPGLSYLHAKSN